MTDNPDEPRQQKLKYSKSSSFYLSTKKDFFSENSRLLEEVLRHNQLYVSQPLRTRCKLCKTELPATTDFTSHGIPYVFCIECSHLNGKFEDTEAFINELYISDDGADYSANYIDQDFVKRTNDIYIPKVDFLISSIPQTHYEILDVGCGCGYFIFAALLKNLKASGLDISRRMVDFGNGQISHHTQKSPLVFEDERGFYDTVIKSSAEVISAIGVIEHLREPHKLFEAFKKSNAKYLYYSVPMFSFSVVLENIFKNVFPRQLSSSHTHLFTEQSIKKMNAMIGGQSVAEWRFGTDAMDLYRNTVVELQKNGCSQKLMDFLYGGLGTKIDEIQATLDRNHFCSEIHCVVSKL